MAMMMCVALLLMLPLHVGGDSPPLDAANRQLRFLDRSLFANFSGELELRAQKPEKMGAVLQPSGEWEAWRQYALSLLKIGGRYHLYYQAFARPHGMEGVEFAATTREAPGRHSLLDRSGMPVKELSQHSLCVAVSDDGVHWEKPSLGIATFNGSRANNILWPKQDFAHCIGEACQGGETMIVWQDEHPDTPSSQRYKVTATVEMPDQAAAAAGPKGGPCMLVSGKPYCWTILASADGLHFTPMGNGSRVLRMKQYDASGLGTADCKVHYYDTEAHKYVAYCQLPRVPPGADAGRPCVGSGGGSIRRIGRCEFDDLFDWRCDLNSSSVSLVMTFDETDPPCVDLYTQDEIGLGGGDRVFFPSVFQHILFADGTGNDGILDIRLAVSRDNGRTIAYPPARDARRPFVTGGINRCSLNQSWLAQSPVGLSWCPRASADSNPAAQMTSFDTSTMYMVNGAAESSDGAWTYL